MAINREIQNAPVTELVKKSSLRHIAFIMDGNGRWAKKRMLPREAGHKVGADNFKTIVRYCKKIGIECCTVYAFSTENIRRPQREVEALFRLLISFIEEAGEEEDIEFRFIGEPGALGETIGRRTRELEDETRGRPYRLNIAFNYGGRAEIVRAVNRLIAEGKTAVTEEDISANLYTNECPEPDLIVRTGAEMRLSNFLLWQSAYAELYFTDRLWPDYTTADVDEAVRVFASRSRRYGGLDKGDAAGVQEGNGNA
ncbi:MAG: di-trans,poly-cis-decaprenylcistransferase [Clostridia bacterium]|nr:di-trans,poly-cis-decaprenylcistransferase [Clostridia bacterium]